MFKKLTQVVLIGFLAWAYQTTLPLPPKVCGSPFGPSITPTSIKLRDGRHLAYKEHGVPKSMTIYKIVYIDDIGHSRHDLPIAIPELAEELGVYFVSFDRPGYGKSDPDPTGAIESIVLDIEELADQLELVPKFYVIGFSMGGNMAWGCLKYIPHRLAGAALLAPAINYWLPGFPANLSALVSQQFPRDLWDLQMAYYTPWLTHWWTSQNGFPVDCAMSGGAKYSRQDLEIMPKLAGRQLHKESAALEGELKAFFRDMMIGFSGRGMDPMDLKNPFRDSEGSVHLWQGDEDGLVPVTLQRYIAERLPWIHYYEIAGAGHLFPYADGMGEAILRALLLGEK